MIKQYPHLRGGERAARRVVEYRSSLIKSDAREPFDELRYKGAVFKIFKECGNATRVPRNTQAPLTRSGSRSTAAQDDQSIMGENDTNVDLPSPAAQRLRQAQSGAPSRIGPTARSPKRAFEWCFRPVVGRSIVASH